jgi:2,3-dihydroxybenzoate decarboxylase
MAKKIALEEHFLCPGFEDYWKTTVGDVDPKIIGGVVARLNDFGDQRLEAMYRGGIERAVLSLTGPGVQIERDTTTAIRKAKECNDFLAAEVQKRPHQYSGLAHLAMQDAKAAADELERCMRDLGFCGAMINGHTNGQYLDHPSLHPFWSRVEELDAIIYLHPADPITPSAALEGHRGLRRATWEWGFETGSHALRLIFGGHFDRFPKAKLALGHMGRPCRSCFAFRQPRQALRHQAGQAAVRLCAREYCGNDVGDVLCRAAQLRDQRARTRARDVLRRLSV